MDDRFVLKHVTRQVGDGRLRRRHGLCPGNGEATAVVTCKKVVLRRHDVLDGMGRIMDAGMGNVVAVFSTVRINGTAVADAKGNGISGSSVALSMADVADSTVKGEANVGQMGNADAVAVAERRLKTNVYVALRRRG